jgi:hypothetical protein
MSRIAADNRSIPAPDGSLVGIAPPVWCHRSSPEASFAARSRPWPAPHKPLVPAAESGHSRCSTPSGGREANSSVLGRRPSQAEASRAIDDFVRLSSPSSR